MICDNFAESQECAGSIPRLERAAKFCALKFARLRCVRSIAMGLLPAVTKFSDEESEEDQCPSLLLFQSCQLLLWSTESYIIYNKSPKLHSGFPPPKPQEPSGSQGMKRPAAACESVPEDNGSTVAKRPAAKQPKGAAKAKVKVQAKKRQRQRLR